jgi:hypothetical protein
MRSGWRGIDLDLGGASYQQPVLIGRDVTPSTPPLLGQRLRDLKMLPVVRFG